jgi:hypothetical protein
VFPQPLKPETAILTAPRLPASFLKRFNVLQMRQRNVFRAQSARFQTRFVDYYALRAICAQHAAENPLGTLFSLAEFTQFRDSPIGNSVQQRAAQSALCLAGLAGFEQHCFSADAFPERFSLSL